jgi:uncharacterized protein (TIGR02646 family)
LIYDPHTPALSTFSFSKEEQDAIEYALTLKDSWKLEQEEMKPVLTTIKSVRDRIKAFHLSRQHHLCCYCRTNLWGDSSFMVDREHIVPKSHCKALTYVISNLSVACKRCNMEIKKNKVAIFKDPKTIHTEHANKDAYRIIHPNYERYEDFILRLQQQEGTAMLVQFTLLNDDPKATYTHDFFKLNDLEVDAIDQAQGIPPPAPIDKLMLDALMAKLNNQPGVVKALLEMLPDSPNDKPRGALASVANSGGTMLASLSEASNELDGGSLELIDPFIQKLLASMQLPAPDPKPTLALSPPSSPDSVADEG